MPHRTDEELLLAFQAHRDCQAIGLLFHRRADELLRVAVFLAPRPSDAEDLLQATFLSAISGVETYRHEHRVMSWLCGILANHARMLRRAERRSPPRPVVEEVEDPSNAALHAELRSALASGIASLPEPYRSVVTLHLEAGLDSQEISQRLSRPPATVRKQMERALDRLRLALPLGLATGLIVRMSPAQLAQQAAEAAHFVEPDAALPLPKASHRVSHASWLVAVAACAGLTALALFALSDGPAAVATLAAAVQSSPEAAFETGADAPIDGEVPVPESGRELAGGVGVGVVRVLAVEVGGAPRADVEVQLVRVNGRALPERLLTGEPTTARTDRDGVAVFHDVAFARYDVTTAGSPPRRGLLVQQAMTECRLTLQREGTLRGVVVDDAGQPIANAEIRVSESSGRGDVGRLLTRSGVDGGFTTQASIGNGRIFARHADHVPSAGARLQADSAYRFVLVAARRSVEVVAHDEHGVPIAGCYVALAPRSNGTELHMPQHGCTDAQGRHRFDDPGERWATVLASHAGLAPQSTDLAPSAEVVELVLSRGGDAVGRAFDPAGRPLANHDVVALVADQRTNEPAAPLLARSARTDAAGSFRFDQLALGEVQFRITSRGSAVDDRRAAPLLLASGTAVVERGVTTQLELQAHEHAERHGSVRDPQGRGLADWSVVAIPQVGNSTFRMFRQRVAATAADGSFVIPGLVPGESYQIGVFPPGRLRNGGQLAVAAALARPVDPPTAFVVDQAALPHAMLRCRVLGENGKPVDGSQLELRAVDFQWTALRAPASDGSVEFGPLAAGRHWLAITTPGAGPRTIEFSIADAQGDLDLGVLTIAAPVRLPMQVRDAQGVPRAAVQVVAQPLPGDKAVVAATDAEGALLLPPLQPGRTSFLVYGRGINPQRFQLDLQHDAKLHEVVVAPTATITVSLPFALASNPLVVNGPLFVQIFASDGNLVLEHHLGAVVERGRFELSTGLLPGEYRLVARALWGAQTDCTFRVTDADQSVIAPLR